jgi:hypothetical protein
LGEGIDLDELGITGAIGFIEPDQNVCDRPRGRWIIPAHGRLDGRPINTLDDADRQTQ